ncbi:MAG: dockerin type I repeat-containing protein [Saprospiraceae bacterium]
MNETTTRIALSVGAVLFFSLLSSAQAIWPGDINNNGIVNGVDYLFWGRGNQSSGPARPTAGADWEAYTMGTPWVQQYPSSINYAYGDINGDGVINANDAIALGANFGRLHGTQTPDNFTGNMGVAAPAMLFDGVGGTVATNGSASVVFALGNENNRFEELYGLTFKMKYPPHSLRVGDGVQFSMFPGAFLNPKILMWLHLSSITRPKAKARLRW